MKDLGQQPPNKLTGTPGDRSTESKFYEFGQNNSGGSFDIDDERGIGVKVWIEAFDVNDANHRAEQIGIYFDGCENGIDCYCCGDRWSPAWGEGESEPEINREFDFNWHDTVYVHRMNGTIERIRAAESLGDSQG